MRDMKVDASSIQLETPLNPSVSCTHRWQALLYYYIFVSSRRDDFGVAALWGRLVACGRLSIGQMSLTSSTLRLRLAAMRGRLLNLRPIVNRPGPLRTTSSRRIANPPQDALPHVARAIPL